MKLLPIQQNNMLNKLNTANNIKSNNELVQTTGNAFTTYPISFHAAQIHQYSKGSTPKVASHLKALNGSLDEKLVKAKDIILKDIGLPSNLVECVDQDLGGKGYAAYSAPLGKVIFDKKFCQKPDSEFSDKAVMCILRHELDHMEVFTKLYKTLGGEEFEKLIKPLYSNEQGEMPKVNHEFYKEMSKHVNIDNFNANKYIDAINNYYMASLGDSHYKNFTDIIKNFDNALENSARDKQYELESLMGVTTLKDFYSMIDETKALINELKKKNPQISEQELNSKFDELYSKAQKETGLEDKTENWGTIIKYAKYYIS